MACFPDSRPSGVCRAATLLSRRQPALRSFRARASHATPTAGPALFAESQIDCVPANRPFGLFGHAHRMLPRRPALWYFRGRKNRKEGNPQKLTQLSSRSHPRHLVGKEDSTRRHHHRYNKRQPGDQQFPIQVVTASLTFTKYFTYFYIYI